MAQQDRFSRLGKRARMSFRGTLFAGIAILVPVAVTFIVLQIVFQWIDGLAHLEIGQAEFAGNLAFVLQGLWENKKKWAGGPFKSYAFVDVETNRFFYIDCGVYSPNKRKEPYLRQIDLMARTFKQVDSTP